MVSGPVPAGNPSAAGGDGATGADLAGARIRAVGAPTEVSPWRGTPTGQ